VIDTKGVTVTISNIKVTLDADIQTVWNIVTSLEDYAWRSDLSTIEILLDGKRFIETIKDGHSTTFTITAFEPLRRYAFDMKNDVMSGHWTGLFAPVEEETGTPGKPEKTLIDFTEDVRAKSLMMRPFVKGYLKKQQETYIRDLRQRVERGDAHSQTR
jgi:hypothetical protein